MLAWALLADAVPLYPLYALLFTDAGLSGAQISLLFAIWSAVGMAAEVPTGLLADRFPRHWSLAAGAVLQAAAYAVWTLRPDFAGFSVGFVLWGIGGAFVSGASEALLYDGLAASGASAGFPELLGRITAVGLVAQLPAAGSATVLFAAGNYPLVGAASVGVCLATAALAVSLRTTTAADGPDPQPEPEPPDQAGGLRSALNELRRSPPVRLAVVAVAALTGLDAFEEYTPLLATSWGVPVVAVPVLLLGLPLAGAVGAVVGGRPRPWSGRVLAVRLGFAGGLLLGACLLRLPIALLGVFAFYAVYQGVAVAAGARLQQSITGGARATVTSFASLAGELTAFATYAAWALGEGIGVALLVLLVATRLPRWLGRATQPGSQLT